MGLYRNWSILGPNYFRVKMGSSCVLINVFGGVIAVFLCTAGGTGWSDFRPRSGGMVYPVLQ